MEHPENNEEYKGLQVNDGVAQPSIINPYLQRSRFRRQELSVDDMVKGILEGNVTILSQAVTLVESVNPQHQKKAQEVIDMLQGVRCGYKSTSCPDQLATALAKALSEQTAG